MKTYLNIIKDSVISDEIEAFKVKRCPFNVQCPSKLLDQCPYLVEMMDEDSSHEVIVWTKDTICIFEGDEEEWSLQNVVNRNLNKLRGNV